MPGFIGFQVKETPVIIEVKIFTGAKSCLQVKKPFPQAPCPFSKKAGRY